MLITIILRATGMTQGELAEYLEVSRASVNAWIQNVNIMTYNSKNLVAERFNIPISFFDLDLKNNKSKICEIYNYLKEFWNKKNNKILDDQMLINQIIDEIELNSKTEEESINYYEASEEEIIDGLCCGYNPFTGEIFSDSHILNNRKIKKTLENLRKLYAIKSKIVLTKDDLNEEDKKLFEELRKWRWDKTKELKYYNAYIVFTDKELINIVTSNIKRKEDLLHVQGIGEKKYQNYGDEIFEIIKTKKYNNLFDFDYFSTSI